MYVASRSRQNDVRSLAALQKFYLTGASEQALSQSTDVFHCPGCGPFSIKSHKRFRFTSPVVNSLLNPAALPSYGSVRRA